MQKVLTAVVAGALAFALAGSVGAAVVTDNNLSSQSLGSLSNNPAQVSIGFPVATNSLVGVNALVSMLSAGWDVNGYHIDGLSGLATAASTNDLVWTLGNLAPAPATYTNSHKLTVISGPYTNLYYNLGVGRWDVGIANYKWHAQNITLYTTAGADAGLVAPTLVGAYGPNRVPNASFEDTNVSFWVGATFVSTNDSKHGAQVAAADGTGLYKTLAVPVAVGRTYAYSFWHKAAGGSARVEWGLTNPNLGSFWGSAAGNTSVAAGASWTEVSGTFTPTNGQTRFYINGRGNPGPTWFDSVYVGELIPFPKGTVIQMR